MWLQGPIVLEDSWPHCLSTFVRGGSIQVLCVPVDFRPSQKSPFASRISHKFYSSSRPLGCERVAVLRHFNRCRAPSHDLPPGVASTAHRAEGVRLLWRSGPGACCHSCGQLQMLLGQRSGVGQEQAVPVQPLPSAAMQEWVTEHTPHGPQDTFLNCPWSSDIAPACQASFPPPPS